jgi:hypothetical protein
MKFTGEDRSTRGKTCPNATLSTTNPTRSDPGSKPGLRGERQTTNRLSHDTVKLILITLQRPRKDLFVISLFFYRTRFNI